MRTIVKMLALAAALLAPPALGAGCVTAGTQFALGNWGCPIPPSVPSGAKAWVVEDAAGPRTLWIGTPDGAPGEAQLWEYRLERFAKPGAAPIPAEQALRGRRAVLPEGAREVPVYEPQWTDQGWAASEGLSRWGLLRWRAADFQVEPPEGASRRRREILGKALMPVTIAIDLGLTPAYLVAGAGIGVYALGKELIE
jgi:hypothetical protein